MHFEPALEFTRGNITVMKPFRLLALVFCWCLTSVFAETSRPTVALDGVWQFKLDPESTGETQGWHETFPKTDGNIKVPGHWAAQGFGKETKEARHSAPGKGWYFRSLPIPAEFARKQVFFRCGGAYRYLRLWIDGQRVDATPQTYAEQFAWNITSHIKAGQTQRITMEVDSVRRPEQDPLMGAGYDFPEYIPMPFLGGGFSGHVWLEAREANWVESLIIRTSVEPRVATVLAELNAPISATAKARFSLIGPDGKTIATQDVAQSSAGAMPILFAQFHVPDAALWSLEKPVLQHCKVEILEGAQVVDSITQRYGWREIRLEREKIFLNGKRIMLRGESDGSNFPDQILPQPDKAFYRKLIAAAKGLGFNFSRHHSHALPEEYLEVCDELGFLATYELPIVYEQYYRKAETEQPGTLPVYERAWRNMITRFRNHPSVFSWGMGNELYAYPAWNYPQTKRMIYPLAAQLYAVAKDLDPTRPVIDSDGIHMVPITPPDPGIQFSSGILDRSTLDYHVQFINAQGGLPFENPTRYALAPFPVKPSIAHEDVNHFTFPRLRRLLDGYNGAVKMHWFVEAREKLEAGGLLDESEKWAENSERLYGAGAKMAIETLRLNPGWSGYHFWQLVDFWTATDGLFDIRMQRKPFPTDREILHWNSPVALLQTGFPIPPVRSGKQIKVQIMGSNFSPDHWNGTQLSWKLISKGREVSGGDLAAAAMPQGTVTQLAELLITFPPVTAPTPIQLHVFLKGSTHTAENEWSCWVYPVEAPKPNLTASVFAEASLLPMLTPARAKLIPTGVLPTHAIYVSSKATPDILAAVEGGARLLLLAPTSGVPSSIRRWSAGWWDGSVAGMENGGTITYGNTPLTRELAPDGWADAGWYHLLDKSRTYPLETWPVKPRLLLRNIDTWQRLADLATLSEFAVGKGRVILSGLVFEPEKWSSSQPEPSRAWAIARLLEAADAPMEALPVVPKGFLLQDFVGVPKGPLHSGVAAATISGGEEALLRTWRGEGETLRFCRINAVSAPLNWSTPPMPAHLEDRVNLVFAGAMGFAAQPEGKFILSINGKEIVRFENSTKRAEWTQVRDTTNFVGEPRLANLRWFPLWNNDQDASGVFVLTVPSEHLPKDKPAELSVQGDGTNSLRWFAIDPSEAAVSEAAKFQ